MRKGATTYEPGDPRPAPLSARSSLRWATARPNSAIRQPHVAICCTLTTHGRPHTPNAGLEPRKRPATVQRLTAARRRLPATVVPPAACHQGGAWWCSLSQGSHRSRLPAHTLTPHETEAAHAGAAVSGHATRTRTARTDRGNPRDGDAVTGHRHGIGEPSRTRLATWIMAHRLDLRVAQVPQRCPLSRVLRTVSRKS